MKKLAVLIPSLTVLPLAGCTSEETTNYSEGYQYAFKSDDIKNYFDIEVELQNEVPDLVGYTQLAVTFDINNSGDYDEGDIRFMAGNIFPSTDNYNYSRWPNNIDFYVETKKAGNQIIRLYEDSSRVISSNITNVHVEDIGGGWLYELKEDGRLTKSVMGLRLNREVENPGEAEDLKTVIDQVSQINSTTPIHVELTNDNRSFESVDYIPSQDSYSQHSNSTMADARYDYIGYQRWVDMVAVSYRSVVKN